MRKGTGMYNVPLCHG